MQGLVSQLYARPPPSTVSTTSRGRALKLRAYVSGYCSVMRDLTSAISHSSNSVY
jgi:hypothetical protein